MDFLAASLKNIKIKIVVTFLAIFLWFYVVTENDYQYTLEVPLKPINIKEGKIIENETPQKAKVMVWGKGKHLISRMVNMDMELVLDLTDVSSYHKFALKKENINIPRASLPITVLQIIEPDSIEIILDDLKRQVVPVIPAVTVKTLAGYTVVGVVQVSPDSILVSGPRRQVSKIKQVFTESKIFKDVKTNLKEKVPLIPISLPKVKMHTKEVEVYADVQKLMEKVIAKVPVQVRNVPPEVKVIVIPPTLTLTLEGGVEVLSSITEKDVTAYIDYQRKLKPDEIGHPAYIETPKWVRYREATPKTFKLVVEKQN